VHLPPQPVLPPLLQPPRDYPRDPDALLSEGNTHVVVGELGPPCGSSAGDPMPVSISATVGSAPARAAERASATSTLYSATPIGPLTLRRNSMQQPPLERIPASTRNASRPTRSGTHAR
jgi:hypothetical protein